MKTHNINHYDSIKKYAVLLVSLASITLATYTMLAMDAGSPEWLACSTKCGIDNDPTAIGHCDKSPNPSACESAWNAKADQCRREKGCE